MPTGMIFDQEREGLRLKSRNLNQKVAIMEKIGCLVGHGNSLKEIMDPLLEIAWEIARPEAAYLYLLDRNTNEITRRAVKPDGVATREPELYRKKEGAVYQVIQSGLPLFLQGGGKNREAPRIQRGESLGFSPRNYLILPLKIKGAVIGAFETVNRVGKETFDDADLDNLWFFSEQACLLLESVRAVHEERRVRSEISSLTRICTQLTSTLGVDPLLGLITLTANEVMRTEASSLFLIDEKTEEVVFHTVLGEAAEKLKSARLKKSEGIVGWVIENGEPLLVEDVNKDPRFNPKVSEEVGFETRSILCAPLKTKDRTIGAIEVINFPAKRLPDEEYCNFLGIFAGYASVAIENARLYERLKKANRELQEKNQTLAAMSQEIIQSEKMLSLGQLAASVAHDINNPLSAIMNFAELSSLTQGLPEQVMKDLASIQSEASRIMKIVKQLLEFSRSKGPELAPARLNDVIADTLTFTEHYLSRFQNVAIEVDFQENLPNAMLSKGQIQQVFVNLIMNAAQAMKDGGRLRIKTFVDGPPNPNEAPPGRHQIIPTRPYGRGGDGEAFRAAPRHYAVASFSDTGTGISEEVMKSIFKPFFTTKAPGLGTGIGLSITKDIVVKHEGHIRVTSAPNEGACFEIYLPIQED